MDAIQNHESLRKSGGAAEDNPSINVGQVRTRSSGNSDRITLDQTKQQLDGAAIIGPNNNDKADIDRPQEAFPWVDRSRRNYALDTDHWSVKQVAVNSTLYEVGVFVELHEPVGSHRVSFVGTLRYTSIFRYPRKRAKPKEWVEFVEIRSINVHKATEDVVIRGLPYARTRNLDGCLPIKRSEVCLILAIDMDDTRTDEEQALLEIGPEDILKKRVLTNTNKSFPHCRFDPIAYATKAQREEQAPLTCRWKMRGVYKSAPQRRAGILQSQAFEHFSERHGHKIKMRNLGIDKERSREWRGDTTLGGSTYLEPDSTDDENICRKSIRLQRYSFAEIAAGAGGASRGAEMAGLKVVLATESWPDACKSYRANFPNTELCQIKTTDLDTDGLQRAVDVLHISSSALKAASGDRDAAQKICTDALNNFHPRFISMEQNAYILSDRNAPLLKAIIRSFTESGFSIQWKITDMVEYGLPQLRKRFIMIGASPGEELPKWPTATHSSHPTGDQQPFNTEKEAIRGLSPVLHSLHNPESLSVINRARRDSGKPIDTMIKSSGSGYHHPGGKRPFTLRELASLQGIPTYHQFEGSGIRRQIGDSMPPSVAMAFYQQLRQHLEEVDGVTSDIIYLEEPAGNSPASLPEAVPNTRVAAGERDELPNGPSDEATLCDPPDIRRSEQHSESLSPRRTRAAVSSPFPRHTISPEAQQEAEPTSPIMQAASPAHIPSTPSTSGHSEAGNRAASLRRRRGRALIEEPSNDRNDDNAGPVTSQTPSKRPRRSLPRNRAQTPKSEESRTILDPSHNAAGQAKDMPTSEDSEKLGCIGPDDETIADLAREL